jgi:Caspase domain
MRKAIIIGFEYKNGKKLPGIAVDIYQVYSFLKEKGWLDEEIKVLTDIKKDAKTEILKTAILEKIVGSGILSFIEDLKERGQYVEFKFHNYYNNFENSFNMTENCFVYFTGHSKNGNIILPNESLISFDTFRNILISNISKEIFLVMDCCEGRISLPFTLNEQIYRLENENCFVKPKIICISSSLENENSLITKSGSFFTRHLFTILSNPNITLSGIIQKLINKLEVKQTANVSASYPNLYLIYSWFYSFPSMNITQYSSHLEIIH